MAELFSGFVCRVSGSATNHFNNLIASKSLEILKKIKEKEEEISSFKEEISRQLFEEISNSTKQVNKNKLLKIRRKAYNLKKLKIEEQNLIKNKDVFGKYKLLLTAIDAKKDLLDKYYESFDSDYVSIRKQFKEVIKEQDFQKGLLISSKALYQNQDIYDKCNKTTLNRKEEQLERGLLRYYSRMSMKATPFGTFCSILPGEIINENNKSNEIVLTLDPTLKESIVIINKGLYGSILSYIVKKKEIKKNLPVELNQTIVNKDDKLVYLTAIEEKEIFQHLDNNEVLELFVEKLEKYDSVLFNDLIKLVCSFEELEATEDEAEEYIDKLVEIGFLRFKLNIPEQLVDWVAPLIQLLNGIDDPDAVQIKGLLLNLRVKIEAYVDADVKRRQELLIEMDDEVKKLFEDLTIESQLKADLPFYEDATSKSNLIINEEYLESASNIFSELIKITQKSAFPITDSITMRHFYDEHYKESSEEISLLKFYEDYYREHYKEHIEKQRKIQSNQKDDTLKDYDVTNPFKLDSVKKVLNAPKQFRNLISKKWIKNGENEIHITLKEIKECYKDIPELADSSCSASVFSQVILQNGGDQKERIFIPDAKYLLGYGKYFSRFLRLMSDEVQSKLYDENNSMSDEIIAEISGDANFNANLHPPLVKYEISYPTSEVGLAEKQIKCEDLLVVPDPHNKFTLRLKQKSSGKFVLPVDLGFLNPTMRPPLFQLIAKFTPPSNYSLAIPDVPVIDNFDKNGKEFKEKIQTKRNKAAQQIVFRPRIIIEDQIVVSRKSWIIPKKHFPEIGKNESLADYFIKLNNWREENNIPKEVYLRIKPLPLPQKAMSENKEDNNENENVKTIAEDKKEVNNEKEVKEKEEVNTENQNKENEESQEQNTDDSQEKKKTKFPKQSRDYYKPQYINFLNPLYVNLFGKLTVNLQNYSVTIEERYPAENQLLSFDGKYFANEQIFQINFPKKNNSKSKNVVELADAEITGN